MPSCLRHQQSVGIALASALLVYDLDLFLKHRPGKNESAARELAADLSKVRELPSGALSGSADVEDFYPRQ